MPPLNWIEEEAGLDSASLTVLAQEVNPTDDGELLWNTFMPRRDVDSTTLKSLTANTFRPVADRREWNQRGRKSIVRLPKTAELEMTPIEEGFTIGEYELQKLGERARGATSIPEAIRNIIRVEVPQRTEDAAAAVYRRIELDAWTAWSLGQVTAKNPQNGDTLTVSYGFSASRMFNAPTAWNDAGVNAYDLLLAFLQDARALVGNVSGVMLRQATFNAIQADAPNAIGTNTPRLTQRALEERLEDELGSAFNFVINERTLDVKTDGGGTVSNVKVWATGRVAAIPAAGGGIIGSMDFAPVIRAYEFANEDNGIDVNGVQAFRETENGGRSLTVEVQANAFPNPNENRIYVVNAGV
jgi:hypothetical protein